MLTIVFMSTDLPVPIPPQNIWFSRDLVDFIFFSFFLKRDLVFYNSLNQDPFCDNS